MKLPIVVDPQQFAEKPQDGLKVVDVRPKDDYTMGHLPNAVQLDLSLLNRSESPAVGLLPDETGAKLLTKAIGLQPNDHVLAYDHGGASAAARLVWVLHAYGFNNVSWLNGGFDAWERAQLPISVDITEPAKTTLELHFNTGNLLLADELMQQLDDADLRVLDVRSSGEFEGTDVRSERGGHVPKAVHSEWTLAFNEQGQLKTDDELRALFTNLNVQPDQHVVVYCQSHQRSALTYLVLKHLQYQRVSALDGAWSVWGNRDDTPIET